MFHRERVEKEYAPLYAEFGLGTTIWSPLASGLLTGKYNEGIPQGTRATLEGYEWLRKRFEDEEAKKRIAQVKQMMPIADELGCSMAQLAIAWCLKNPHDHRSLKTRTGAREHESSGGRSQAHSRNNGED